MSNYRNKIVRWLTTPYSKGLVAVLFFLVIVPSLLNAQTFYSTRTDYLKIKTDKQVLINEFVSSAIDTTVLFAADMPFRNAMGGMGFSSPLLKFNASKRNIGFTYFQLPLHDSRISLQDVLYYKTLGPFADVSGAAGAGNLQQFKFLFTQTFFKKVNFTLRLNRNTFIGQYTRQNSLLNNVYLSSNYESTNKKFGYYFVALQNTNLNSESGGIVDGTLNSTTAFLRKSLLNVNLSSASRENRQVLLQAKPYFLLNAGRSNPKALHYLQMSAGADMQSIKYLDAKSASDGFYNTFNYDTLRTRDSSNVKQFTNDISYVLKGKNNGFGFSLGYKNEQIRTWQKNTSYFDNGIVHAEAMLNKVLKQSDSNSTNNSTLHLQASTDQVLHGYNAGDLASRLQLCFLQSKKWNTQLTAAFGFENRKPDQNFLIWRSNHFEWRNHFQQQQIFDAGLGFKLNKIIAFDVLYQSINHLLYFDSTAAPAQLQEKTNNLAASLSFSKVFLKHIGIYVSHTYQQTSAAEVLKVPAQTSVVKLYYHADVKNKPLQINIGAQLRFYQSYNVYAYMPATQVFYLQNARNSGNFPYLDVYLSGRIRPVTFFVKLENILAGYAGYDYFLVAGYYQPELAFRMGITWQFWD